MTAPRISRLLIAFLGAMCLRATAAPLPSEQLTVEKLPPQNPHWGYIVDEAFVNEIDSRVWLLDGDTYQRRGQIGAGFYPGAILSPDGKTTAVATTYFSRGTRGTRTDLVELTDNATLTVSGEIVLPPKRALTLPTIFNLGYSTDSKFLYVAYVTPAAAFGVLDPAKRQVLSEIDTAGCVLVIPWGPNNVSSICESGRLLTVQIDDRGREVTRSMSQPFFDADTDPVFVQGIPASHGYIFLSFLGQVHDINFDGPQPVAAPAWSILPRSERGHWRPGGMQVGAIHRKLGHLYVPVHEGGEGSHKEGGTEIWVLDTATHARLARWPVPAKKFGKILGIQVTQDDQPIVFATTELSNVIIFDGISGAVRHVEKQLGQSPWTILTPDVWNGK